MSEIHIVTYPDKVLKQKCAQVLPDEFPAILELYPKMLKLMHDSNGIGLAANQIGMLQSFFVMRVPGRRARLVINPEILVRSSDVKTGIEGCLSFPGRKVYVNRAKKIGVEYINDRLELQQEELDGLESVCFLHEYDHLAGKTLLDREYKGRKIV